ncbi:MAG: MFS transporter [Syntrophorhabdales bacterium]
MVTLLDGFDLTIIGVALPKIADFLHSKPNALGLALTAGLFGPVIGAVVLGTLADRFGRKWMLVISAVIFGSFTAATVTITTVEQLALFRFLAGLGLGGAVPNALAFGSEYAPTRSRQGIVTAMYTGMPTGSMMGGLSAAWLIPHFGWQSLFAVGGGISVLIGLAVAALLPESLEFLIKRGRDKVRIRKIVSRISPALCKNEQVQFISGGKKLPGVPIKHLFTDGRALTTILLWFICGGAIYIVWMLNMWQPTLLRRSGATVQQYSLAYASLYFGGVVSSIFVGRLMDKFNPLRVLQIGFILAFIALSAFGLIAGSGSPLAIAAISLVCGLFVHGSQTGTLAAATVAYPPAIRGTGIGWAYAVAKVFAMAAPAVGGFLLSRNWGVSSICSSQAVVGIFVAALLVVLHSRLRGATARTGKAAAGDSRVLPAGE